MKNAKEAIDKILKEQERQKRERQEREKQERKRQEEELSSCTTTDDVVYLYSREKTAWIDVEKCSSRAYELSKSMSDYRKVVSVLVVSL